MSTPPQKPPERSLPAEVAEALDEGIRRFAAGDPEGAHEMFGIAHRRAPGEPRVQSWFGLTLVLVEKNSNLGVVLCDEALRVHGPEPELLLNQARLHLALRQRERAVRALLRGLELWPDDPRLVAARDALGVRRPPVIRFLSRNNPLNRILGRLRYRWIQRNVPDYELSPVALGVPLPRPDEKPRS